VTRRCLRALRCHRPMRFVLDEIRPMHDEIHHDFLPNLKLCAPAVASVVLTFTGPHRAVGTRARNAYYCRLPTDKEKHRGSRDTHGTLTGCRVCRVNVHTGCTGAHGHTDHTYEPLNHPNPPSTNAPCKHQHTKPHTAHDRASSKPSTTESAADSATTPEPTEPPWALGPCRSHLRP
jgi:hypothetical protein